MFMYIVSAIRSCMPCGIPTNFILKLLQMSMVHIEAYLYLCYSNMIQMFGLLIRYFCQSEDKPTIAHLRPAVRPRPPRTPAARRARPCRPASPDICCLARSIHTFILKVQLYNRLFMYLVQGQSCTILVFFQMSESP